MSVGLRLAGLCNVTNSDAIVLTRGTIRGVTDRLKFERVNVCFCGVTSSDPSRVGGHLSNVVTDVSVKSVLIFRSPA